MHYEPNQKVMAVLKAVLRGERATQVPVPPRPTVEEVAAASIPLMPQRLAWSTTERYGWALVYYVVPELGADSDPTHALADVLSTWKSVSSESKAARFVAKLAYEQGWIGTAKGYDNAH